MQRALLLRSNSSAETCSLLNLIPPEVLYELFMWIPPKELCSSLNLVCKRWCEVSSESTLWHALGIKYGVILPEAKEELVLSALVPTWKEYFWKNNFRKNLILNPCGDEQFTHWDVNAEYNWRIEEYGKDCQAAVDLNCKNSFASSYNWSIKTQIIDLIQIGFTRPQLDYCPEIQISEWYCGRHDCGSEYKLCVKLQNEKHELLDMFETGGRTEPEIWNEEKHTFAGYPKGLRFIEFTSQGKDTRWWDGYYGAKMTAASVKVFPIKTVKPSKARRARAKRRGKRRNQK
eukprot:TRINITY_DN1596_c0_g1_i1.p1 TRINITY_DN1596_c0_g1~~TRINITY_DN1596_c0_g1_i1.p1  ORF type:complete len:288 (-),score=44.74 TRINITY_DN1596_c0_g1_i1:66-929(-)